MQPTSNQTVPATSSLPSQTVDRQPSAPNPAPAPLDAEMLRLVSGGTVGPAGGW